MGAVRLDDVTAHYGDQVEVAWHSYLLRPEPEPRPLDEFTAYTRKWERPASLEPRATFNEWSGANAPPSHSLPSALAGKVAETFGQQAQHEFSTRVFQAYFTENRTISDPIVLAEIALESGLDRAAFEQRWTELESDLVKQVWRDYTTAVQSGIRGVPAVVVNRRYLVSGAVDLAEYQRVIDSVLEGRTPAGYGEGATEDA